MLEEGFSRGIASRGEYVAVWCGLVPDVDHGRRPASLASRWSMIKSHLIGEHRLAKPRLLQDVGARPLYSAPMVPLLPGADLVEQGIADLAHGVESVPALLVSIGGPRLR